MSIRDFLLSIRRRSVTAPPGFTFSAGGPVTLERGSSVSLGLSVTRSGGHTAPIAVTVSGLAGVTAAPLTINAGSGTLTLSADYEASTGPLTIIAASGALTRTITVPVTVTGGAYTLVRSAAGSGLLPLTIPFTAADGASFASLSPAWAQVVGGIGSVSGNAGQYNAPYSWGYPAQTPFSDGTVQADLLAGTTFRLRIAQAAGQWDHIKLEVTGDHIWVYDVVGGTQTYRGDVNLTTSGPGGTALDMTAFKTFRVLLAGASLTIQIVEGGTPRTIGGPFTMSVTQAGAAGLGTEGAPTATNGRFDNLIITPSGATSSVAIANIPAGWSVVNRATGAVASGGVLAITANGQTVDLKDAGNVVRSSLTVSAGDSLTVQAGGSGAVNAPLPLTDYDLVVDANAAPGGTGSLASPLRTVEEAYHAAVAGQKILLRAGVHRRSSALNITKVLEIHGEVGAVWSGSEDWSLPARAGVNAWALVSGTLYRTPYPWVTISTTDGNRETTPNDGYARYQRADNALYPSPVADPQASNNRATRPHAVFLNGVPLYQEMSQAACDGTPTRSTANQTRWLGLNHPGTFYVDESGHWLYLNAGRALTNSDLIEVTVSHKWVTSGVSGAVTFRNLTFRHAWARIQRACFKPGGGWVVKDCTFEWGLGRLFDVSTNLLSEGNAFRYSGQLAIGGSASGWVVRGGSIKYSNTEECDIGFEAGATKFAFCNAGTFEGVEVAYNFGEGTWWDIDNGDTTACLTRNCKVHHNARSGIFWEISGVAGKGNLIEGNACWENGHWAEYIGAAAGITVTSSNGVEVRNNILAWNANAVVVRADSRASQASYDALNDINVHDNLMVGFNSPGRTLPGPNAQFGGKGYLLAYIADGGYESRIFGSGRNIRGSTNRYHHTGTAKWAWQGDKLTLTDFNSTPGEEGGTTISLAAAQAELTAAGVPTAVEAGW